MRAGRQAILPELRAAGDVIGADIIVGGRGQEGDAAGGGDRAAEARHTHPDRDRQRRAVADGAVAMHPDDCLGVEVDPGHVAPGRAHAWQPQRRQERIQLHAERRAIHRLHPDLTAWRVRAVRRGGVVGATRDQFGDERNRDRIGDHDPAHRIDRDTAPFEHAEIAGKHQRALQGWRRERALIAHPLKQDAAGELVEDGGAPHVGSGEFLFRPERQFGKRLRRRQPIAGRWPLRHRTLRRRDDQRTGAAIEHKQVAGFRRHQDRRHRTIRGRHIGQCRLRRQVHVPEIVMHCLVGPSPLAGVDVERHQRARIALAERIAVAAPDVRRPHPHRQIHQPQLRVVGRGDPGVRRVVGVGVGGRRQRVFVGRAGIPGPDQFSSVDVEAPDHAGGFFGGVIVDDGAADHDDLVADHRRRGRLVEARRLDAHALLEVERAVIGEAFAGLAGVGIDRDHAAVIDRQEDLSRAIGRRRLALGVDRARRRLVIGHAAAGQVLKRGVALELRIEGPTHRAGFGIEREQLLMLRTQIQCVPHLDRRHLEGSLGRIAQALTIAGAEGPGHLELADIAGRDLLQRRIALAGLTATVGAPVVVRLVGCVCRRSSRRAPRGNRALALVIWRNAETKIKGKPDRQHHDTRGDGQPQRQGRRPADHAERWREMSCHPGGEQPEAEGKHDIAAGGQRPPVEPDLGHRPGQRADQHRGIDPQRGPMVRDQQQSGYHDAKAGDEIKRRTAQRDQPPAAAHEGKADQGIDNARDQHDARSSLWLHVYPAPTIDDLTSGAGIRFH